MTNSRMDSKTISKQFYSCRTVNRTWSSLLLKPQLTVKSQEIYLHQGPNQRTKVVFAYGGRQFPVGTIRDQWGQNHNIFSTV